MNSPLKKPKAAGQQRQTPERPHAAPRANAAARPANAHASHSFKRAPAPPTAPSAPRVLQPKAAGPAQTRTPPAAPPVYRPQPTPKVLQTKTALARQTQPPPARVPTAPPAYVPARASATLQRKSVEAPTRPSAVPRRQPATPDVYRPSHIPARAGATAPAAPSPAARVPTRAVVQRMMANNTLEELQDTILANAWPVVLNHWRNVMVTDQNAVEQKRTSSTQSTLFVPELVDYLPNFFTSNTISSPMKNSVHAEGGTLDKLAEGCDSMEEFRAMLCNEEGNAHFQCGGNKASCFLCSAVAHVLGASVQKKDTRGYGRKYRFANVLAETNYYLFGRLIGQAAYTDFLRLNERDRDMLFNSFPRLLYEKNKGYGSNFKTN